MTRLFVKYDRQGEILAVAKLDELPEGQENPFVDDDPDSEIIEIPQTSALMDMEPDDIHTGYAVDTQAKTLKKI